MGYEEPKIKSMIQNNPKYNTGTTPTLIPVILGEGWGQLEKTVEIVRGSGNEDILPDDENIVIGSIGNLRNSTDYSSADYTLALNVLSWKVDAVAKPVEGQSYYITYKYDPPASHYEAKYLTQKGDVQKIYGKQIDSNGDVCPIVIGAELALEGTNEIYTIQVKPAELEIASSDFEKALSDNARFLEDGYRIIVLDIDPVTNLAVISHVNEMSDPEEGMERVTILGVDHTSTDFTSLLSSVGTYASSMSNRRVSVIYPDRATKVLDDGNTYELPGQYICAALAGWKAGKRPQTAFTKGTMICFNELKGLKLTRKEKNKLAENGVMIIEQNAGPGTPIEIRHGLTTDMTSPQTREASIIDIADYASKYYRKGLKTYLGQHNITSDLITAIKGSITSMTDILVKDKVIISGKIVNIYQDEITPTTLVVQLSIEPPYPCNNIELTLFLE